MRGKWAQGIEPRHFTWVLKDRFAVCERPGGYGANHRRVRRQEEIIWLCQHDFDFAISLISGTHNLHNYDELGLPFHHVPYSGPEDGAERLTRVMATIRDHLDAGDRIVVHREELGERVSGLVAAYLLWTGLVPDGPHVINVTEQLFERELGPVARRTVTLVDRCPPSADVPAGAFADETPPGEPAAEAEDPIADDSVSEDSVSDDSVSEDSDA